MSSYRQYRASRSQRGAATLVIVMVLFLVMALLAAYANRSMLFEQRIANSYFRASVAQEVAEAGLEWSLAQLNGGANNPSCTPVATGGTRFVDRYLTISAADRGIKQGVTAGMVADCTRSGSSWTCRCPALGAWTAPTAVTGTAMTPSFGISIQPIEPTDPAGAGTVQLTSLGCTESVASLCQDADTNSRAAQGASRQRAHVALVSAVRSPPASPLVVKGDVTVTGTGLGLHNTDVRSSGLLYAVGGNVSGFNDSRLNSVPGTSPTQARVANDESLEPPPGKPPRDVFQMFMGTTTARYQQHPSLRTVTCSGDCAPALTAAYAAGLRILWINGPLEISSNVVLGSPADPVVIIATGDVTLSGAFQLSGMLVASGTANTTTWTNTSGASSMILGMLLVEGNLVTNGAMDIVYQPAIADQLRNRVGSWVRVPGSWFDID
jgi:Tfp pilus assembly protein PilX